MRDTRRFPKVSVDVRTLKMAIATALCALLYGWLLPHRNPAFACIGVIFGIGETKMESWKIGGNRMFGTIIGGVLGMVLFRIYLFIRPQGGASLWLIPLVFIGVVLLNLLCDRLWPGGLLPGGVVLCILLYATPVETYVTYAVNRIIDTSLGVLFAWAISFFDPKAFRRIPARIRAARAHSASRK